MSRFHEFVRKILIPFAKIEKYFPQKGKILDIGCGHGTFTRLLASKSKKRQVLGIDPSEKKILYAKSLNCYKNLNYRRCFLEDLRNEKFDAVSIIDVLYLLDRKGKENLLKKTASLLKKNGILVLKEVDTKPNWQLKILQIEEYFMINIFKKTYSSNSRTQIISPSFYKNLLKRIGFRILKEEYFRGKIGYPSHFALVAKPE